MEMENFCSGASWLSALECVNSWFSDQKLYTLQIYDVHDICPGLRPVSFSSHLSNPDQDFKRGLKITDYLNPT